MRYSWVLCWDQSENLNPSSLDPLLSALPSQSLSRIPEAQPQTLFTLVGEEEPGQGS